MIILVTSILLLDLPVGSLGGGGKILLEDFEAILEVCSGGDCEIELAFAGGGDGLKVKGLVIGEETT